VHTDVARWVGQEAGAVGRAEEGIASTSSRKSRVCSASTASKVESLILDDLALQPLGTVETSDFYEVIVERHRSASTITTSNRDPAEIVTMMADSLLAQSAIDRLGSAAYELVVEGASYRQRQKPTTATVSHPRRAAMSEQRTNRCPRLRALIS
jgi:hypothetical protein